MLQRAMTAAALMKKLILKYDKNFEKYVDYRQIRNKDNSVRKDQNGGEEKESKGK